MPPIPFPYTGLRLPYSGVRGGMSPFPKRGELCIHIFHIPPPFNLGGIFNSLGVMPPLKVQGGLMPAIYRGVLKARCILELSLGESPIGDVPEGFHIYWPPTAGGFLLLLIMPKGKYLWSRMRTYGMRYWIIILA